jgi:seryl-tRNA synthetase
MQAEEDKRKRLEEQVAQMQAERKRVEELAAQMQAEEDKRKRAEEMKTLMADKAKLAAQAAALERAADAGIEDIEGLVSERTEHEKEMLAQLQGLQDGISATEELGSTGALHVGQHVKAEIVDFEAIKGATLLTNQEEEDRATAVALQMAEYQDIDGEPLQPDDLPGAAALVDQINALRADEAAALPEDPIDDRNLEDSCEENWLQDR